MDFKCKLPIPQEIKKQFPMTEEGLKIKEERDRELRDIFEGKERKLVLGENP